MENLFKLNTNESLTDNYAKYAEILLEPWSHFSDGNKGVDFRKRYIEAYNYWLKLDKTEVELTMDFFEWYHFTYIVLDDLQDSTDQRRGIPAAHVLYGAGRTITAIDVSIANLYLTGKGNPSTEVLQEPYNTDILQKMGLKYICQFIIQGQAMDTYWRDNYICPSEKEYFEMIYRKSGYCFLAISEFMEVFTKTKINLSKTSFLFGTFNQIADDYRGLTSKLMCESTGFCDDIREGKFTLPFVHAINSRPNDKRLMSILSMRTNDIDLKKKCLELLEEFGSMEFTKNKILTYKTLIKQELERLGLNDNKFKILFELHTYDI